MKHFSFNSSRFKLSYFACLLLLFTPLISQAQDSSLGNWMIYFGNKKIDSKWNWHHEVQYRNYNAIGDLEQLLLRTGIGYNLSENNNNLLLGYGFINSQNYNGNDEKTGVNEHRTYQQFITKQKFSYISFQHRYRFEQRWVENQDFKLRFRYFLSINVPVYKKAGEDKSLYLSAYNEIFLNTVQGQYFDRNRLYGGIGFRLNKLVRFEVGYMNQFLSAANRDQLNLIMFLNF